MAIADIKITEVLYNPVTQADENFEFIEIFNSGLEDVDLQGWILREIGGVSSVSISTGMSTILGSAQHAVIVPNGTTQVAFEAVYGALPPGTVFVEASGGLDLDNTGDSIELVAPGDIIVDQVVYPDTADGEVFDQSLSISRTAQDAPVFTVQTPNPGTSNSPTQGDDNLSGTNADETISLLDGDDKFTGNGGDDTVNGGYGEDILNGKGGEDVLRGDEGDDKLTGGSSNDKLYGGDDNDTIRGNGGHDLLQGNAGDDDINGNGGRDRAQGGLGDDTVRGGNGNDIVHGNKGNDTLFGDAGNDRVIDAQGDSTLDGGTGNDILKGGAGADTFVFSIGSDIDQILDYGTGADIMDVSAYGLAGIGDLTIFQDGSDVVVVITGTDSITLNKTLITEIDSSDFIF